VIKLLDKVGNIVAYEKISQRSEEVKECVQFVKNNKGIINSEPLLEAAILGLYIQIGVAHDKQAVLDRTQHLTNASR
jgi:hypothetical protein